MQSISRQAQIRPFRADDISVVRQILHESPDAANWSPTSPEVLGEAGLLAFVSEVESSVTGFIIARQVADEAEILNIAIKPQSRRAGHGSTLLLAAQQAFQQQHITHIILEVRESNAGAIAFYRKHGFVPTGRRKSYYSNPREDAVLMEKKLRA